ncbi:hypothetical protein [Streptomyces lycii]|uniref:Uncharacterized protein n=1 Tax=Streptomyces lycii TaxID=2654337 RepID=A0ABQ7FR05_9ACTN|nr:hypothetical protein [Streptomyces lycii]KAF4410909.1 hypothetical protein GCU69_01430 [Streptomyces lycii]
MKYNGPKKDFRVSNDIADIAATIVRDRHSVDVRSHELYPAFAALFAAEIGREPRKWLKRGNGWFARMDDVFYATGDHPDVF